MRVWGEIWRRLRKIKQQRHVTVTVPVALLCLTLVSIVSVQFVGASGAPPLLASMGAAAVLMFYAPASPMATFWAFICGNLLSAVVGVTCRMFLPENVFLGPLTVALAILLMHLCRCQHPPGGATALVAVIGGPEIYQLGYTYVLTPVLLNLSIFLLGVLLHRQLLTYLARSDQLNARLLSIIKQDQSAQLPVASDIYQHEDLVNALKHYDSTLDISTQKLNEIFQLTLFQAKTRQLKVQSCVEIAVGHNATTEYGEYLLDAFKKMQMLEVDYLVVIDRSKHVLGYISLYHLSEFLNSDPKTTALASFHTALKPSGNLHSNTAEFVGQVMQDVVSVHAEESAINVVLKGEEDLYAVVDDKQHFLGYVLKTSIIP